MLIILYKKCYGYVVQKLNRFFKLSWTVCLLVDCYCSQDNDLNLLLYRCVDPNLTCVNDVFLYFQRCHLNKFVKWHKSKTNINPVRSTYIIIQGFFLNFFICNQNTIGLTKYTETIKTTPQKWIRWINEKRKQTRPRSSSHMNNYNVVPRSFSFKKIDNSHQNTWENIFLCASQTWHGNKDLSRMLKLESIK